MGTQLEDIRAKLDELDNRLVTTIAERLALIPNVAEYKRDNGMQRYQPEREARMIEERRALAKQHGVNPDLIEDITRRLIEEAHRVEKDIMGE